MPADAAGALCRLVRGFPPAPAGRELSALEAAALVAPVAAGECEDAARCAALFQERARLRDELAHLGAPRGLFALVPGAARRARERAGTAQAALDAADQERRRIEDAYPAVARGCWPAFAFAAPLPDGGRILITAEGYRHAFAFWSGPDALPCLPALRESLAGHAGRAAEVAAGLASWRRMPPETTWTAAALLAAAPAPQSALEALSVLFTWLHRQDLWAQDPFPLALALALSGRAATAGRDAAGAYEALRARGFEADVGTFAAACRLAARPSWLPMETRLDSLEWLSRRGDDLGLMAHHRMLPLLASLACLPRPPAETGQAVGALRASLRRRYPSAPATLEVAVVLLAGAGFFHAARHAEQDLLARANPVVDALAQRWEALRQALPALDGSVPGPGGRLEALAGAAAFLPGPVGAGASSLRGLSGLSGGHAAALLAVARQALSDAGAPPEACRAPAAIALAGAACGAGAGCHPTEWAWELLRVDEMAETSWRQAQAPSGGVA